MIKTVIITVELLIISGSLLFKNAGRKNPAFLYPSDANRSESILQCCRQDREKRRLNRSVLSTTLEIGFRSFE